MTTQTPKRHRGTQSDGCAFTPDRKEALWESAKNTMTDHPLLTAACKFFSKEFKEGTYVLDDYGHVICKDEYGQQTKHGWEIDHIHPVENKDSYPGGAASIDEPTNLRALHWASNQRKGTSDARIYELEYEHILLKENVA